MAKGPPWVAATERNRVSFSAFMALVSALSSDKCSFSFDFFDGLTRFPATLAECL